MAVGKLERALYRSLLRLGRNFDHPLLKALICRNHGNVTLPAGLDAVVARFLGGASYYWPSPAQLRVTDVVREAFRQPLPGGDVEAAFAGVRYLSGLLRVARKHQLLEGEQLALEGETKGQTGLAAAASLSQEAQQQQVQQQQVQAQEQHSAEQQHSANREQHQQGQHQQQQQQQWEERKGGLELVAAPERGTVLLAHPCMPGSVFSRSVVLLCRHESEQGSYGFVVNKPLGSSLRHLHDRFRQLPGAQGSVRVVISGSSAAHGGGGSGSGGSMGDGSGAAGSTAGSTPAGLTAGRGQAGSGASVIDIPAHQLQAVMDSALQAALALSHFYPTAADSQGSEDVDEHGNWIEAPYESAGEEEEDEAGSWGLAGEGMQEEDESDSQGSSSEDEAGYRRGHRGYRAGGQGQGGGEEGEEKASSVMAARGGADGMPVDLGRLLAAAAGQPQQGLGSDVEPVLLEEDDTGIVAVLHEALRRAGGGIALVLDPTGQLWAQTLPQGDYSPHDEDDSEGEEGEGAQEAQQGLAGLAEESPAALSDLLKQSLSAKGRLLLAAQQQAAQRQQTQQQQQQQRQQQPEQAGEQLGDAKNGNLARVKRFSAEVERLIESKVGQQPPTALGSHNQQQQQQQQLQPLYAAGSGSSLFGTGTGGSSAAPGAASAITALGSRDPGDSDSDDSAVSPTASQIMLLFAESPLFRGGPVPGLTVLHRRPRLGGELVLAPLSHSSSTGPAALEGISAAAEAPKGEGEDGVVDGGIMVGADLTKAQALAEEGYWEPEDVRVCMGESAWLPGQLEEEAARGSWVVARVDPEFLDLFSPAATHASTLLASTNSEPSGDSTGSLGSSPGGSTSSLGSGMSSPGGLEAAARGMATAWAIGRGQGEEGGQVPSAAFAYEDAMWAQCLTALGGEYAELARMPRGVWRDLAELEV